MDKKKIGIIVLIIGLSVAAITIQNKYIYKSVPLKDIINDLESYKGERVKVYGYIVSYEGAFMGPKYHISEDRTDGEFDVEKADLYPISFDNENVITFADYVSYEYRESEMIDGEFVLVREYTKIDKIPVTIYGEVAEFEPCAGCSEHIIVHEIKQI
jgi:hypothetical protein